MTQSRRAAYLDAYERHYQNCRDDGWPADRARVWAEAQATHETTRKPNAKEECR